MRLKEVLVTLLITIATINTTQAQTPNSFPYQAAARSANGRPLANKVITVRISLRDSVASGTVVYRETHGLTTNALGLFDLRVGQGTMVTGSFSTINWGGTAKFIQTEIDTGSGNFLDMGTTQLLSVPYAMYAQNSGNGVPSGGTDGQVLTRCNGQLIWTTGGQCPGTLTALNCASSTTTGTLTSGTTASGVSSSIPYTGGNGGTYNGQTVTSTGVTGLTATLAASTLATGAGSLIYTITGTPSAAGTASFAISLGGQSCTLTRTVSLPAAALTSLNCASATTTGTLISGTAASGVSSSIPYTGGNGGTHTGQTITSTGVTGLTATLTAGTLATGAGSLTYTITGTPSAAGTASFALSLGGQSCTLPLSVQPSYPAGTVHCNGTPTLVVEVTNPITGKVWMDRNLGAIRAATSSTDAQAFGDLYQWGRRGDGHQCRNSATTTILSSTDQPAHGSFILTNSSTNDWRAPQTTSRWQGINGVNNPCPNGFRIPSVAEFDAERLSWSNANATGAMASPLKLPMAGRRIWNTGVIESGNPTGFYWTSGISIPYSQDFVFTATNVLPASNLQWIAIGNSVRCIKN